VAERETLEAEILQNEDKINNNNISICHGDPLSGAAFLEKVRDEFMANLEEEWDIAMSIKEIQNLENDNKAQILNLANEMEDLIEQKDQVT